MTMDDQGSACTLNRDEVARRAELLQDLADQVLETHHGLRTAVLRFPSGSEDAVQRFVALESRCCSFLTFGHDRTGTDLMLTVSVPDGAEPLLAELVEAIDPEVALAARVAAVDRMRSRPI
jgi:hypothetical protein